MITRIQKVVACCGVGLFVLMGLFPPWLYTLDVTGHHWNKDAGYAIIFSPSNPSPHGDYVGIRVDTQRLLIQWVCVATMTGAALVFLRISAGERAKQRDIKKEVLDTVVADLMKAKLESPKMEVREIAISILDAIDKITGAQKKRTFGWGTICIVAMLSFFVGGFTQFCTSSRTPPVIQFTPAQ